MKRYGVVIADEFEFIPFVRLAEAYGIDSYSLGGRECVGFDFSEKIHVDAIKCGIGKVNAASAASYLIAYKKVDTIFNIGLSGALTGFAKGELVAGRSFIECDFDLSPLGYEPGVKPQDCYRYAADETLLKTAVANCDVKTSDFGCGDFFLADKAKANEFIKNFSVSVFDMETGAIASVCKDFEIPFFSLRQISDDADDVSPDTYNKANNRKDVSLTETLFKLFRCL